MCIVIPKVQQQDNGIECGLFAIANLFEFIVDRYKSIKDNKLYIVFEVNEMCKHLVYCLENKLIDPFPPKKT